MKVLNYQFQDRGLLETALTHKSFSHENPSESHNERLEFLGDAVLDLILGEELMLRWPEANEGSLSKMRAHLVNEASLAARAIQLNLPESLRLGKSELLSQGEKKPRLLAGVFEALMGALYLDAGYQTTKEAVKTIFQMEMQRLSEVPQFDQDYKTQLQEYLQALIKKTPNYSVVGELGPSHDRIFEVIVSVGDQVLAKAQGKSKKAAEQNAARLGLEFYQENARQSSSKGCDT